MNNQEQALRDRFLDSFKRVRQEHKDYAQSRPRSKTALANGLSDIDIGKLVDKHFGADLDRGDTVRLDAWLKVNVPKGTNIEAERRKLIKLRQIYRAAGGK